jgi:hypothetical protein
VLPYCPECGGKLNWGSSQTVCLPELGTTSMAQLEAANDKKYERTLPKMIKHQRHDDYLTGGLATKTRKVNFSLIILTTRCITF